MRCAQASPADCYMYGMHAAGSATSMYNPKLLARSQSEPAQPFLFGIHAGQSEFAMHAGQGEFAMHAGQLSPLHAPMSKDMLDLMLPSSADLQLDTVSSAQLLRSASVTAQFSQFSLGSPDSSSEELPLLGADDDSAVHISSSQDTVVDPSSPLVAHNFHLMAEFPGGILSQLEMLTGGKATCSANSLDLFSEGSPGCAATPLLDIDFSTGATNTPEAGTPIDFSKSLDLFMGSGASTGVSTPSASPEHDAFDPSAMVESMDFSFIPDGAWDAL
jgi:hypothetical protein